MDYGMIQPSNTNGPNCQTGWLVDDNSDRYSWYPCDMEQTAE